MGILPYFEWELQGIEAFLEKGHRNGAGRWRPVLLFDEYIAGKERDKDPI
jgi:hypothetical protein